MNNKEQTTPSIEKQDAAPAKPGPAAYPLDFSRPLETIHGKAVKHICSDVIEYECARVCVDQSTGIVYSSPYIGLKIRNAAAPAAPVAQPLAPSGAVPDERAAFEKEIKWLWRPCILDLTTDRSGDYSDRELFVCWRMWQARAALTAQPLAGQDVRAVTDLEPMIGDLLPAVGSKVFIHLAREDEWAEHTVTGYYVWGDLGGQKHLHRVFVRVKDAEGCSNARLLRDVRLAAPSPVNPKQEQKP